ncbi:hypothetical protein [Streptomyces sp. NPDC058695]|uniref:hypothetical protein n=1 Tax=Streptomyces sp. NPDC058695 TaxID=3346604 RepID=UPI00364975E7
MTRRSATYVAQGAECGNAFVQQPDCSPQVEAVARGDLFAAVGEVRVLAVQWRPAAGKYLAIAETDSIPDFSPCRPRT